jgi:hypothetical protein
MYRLPPNEKKILLNSDDEPDFYHISDLLPLPSNATIPDSIAISRTDDVRDVVPRGTFPADASMKVNPHPLVHQESSTATSPESRVDVSLLQQQHHHFVLQQQQRQLQQQHELQQQQLQQIQELQQLLQAGAARVDVPPQAPVTFLRDETTSSSEPFVNNNNVSAMPMMILQQQQYQLEQMRHLEQLRQQEQQLVGLNSPAGMVAYQDPQQQQRQIQQQQILFLNQAMSEPSTMISPTWNFDGSFQAAVPLPDNPMAFSPPQDTVAPPLPPINNMLDVAEFLAHLQTNNEGQELQER